MPVEIVPAILVKSREEFERRFSQVAPFVSRVQIDIMDGKFVPNTTLPVEEFPPLHGIEVEYHLMVEDPLEYVEKIGKSKAIYELHIESFTKAGGRGGRSRNADARKDIVDAIEKVGRIGGKAALALSPDTPVEEVEPYLGMIEQVLVMTVYPGFSGQRYIPSMESKIRWLKSKGAIVEVDGGIDVGSARRAAKAGATLLGVASAIFSKPDVKGAIERIRKDAEGS